MATPEGQRCSLRLQAPCGIGMELTEMPQNRVKTLKWQASHNGLAHLTGAPPSLASVHRGDTVPDLETSACCTQEDRLIAFAVSNPNPANDLPQFLTQAGAAALGSACWGWGWGGGPAWGGLSGSWEGLYSRCQCPL